MRARDRHRAVYDCAVVEKPRFTDVVPPNYENSSAFGRMANRASGDEKLDVREPVSIEEGNLKVEKVARFFPHHCTNIGMTTWT